MCLLFIPSAEIAVARCFFFFCSLFTRTWCFIARMRYRTFMANQQRQTVHEKSQQQGEEEEGKNTELCAKCRVFFILMFNNFAVVIASHNIWAHIDCVLSVHCAQVHRSQSIGPWIRATARSSIRDGNRSCVAATPGNTNTFYWLRLETNGQHFHSAQDKNIVPSECVIFLFRYPCDIGYIVYVAEYRKPSAENAKNVIVQQQQQQLQTSQSQYHAASIRSD